MAFVISDVCVFDGDGAYVRTVRQVVPIDCNGLAGAPTSYIDGPTISATAPVLPAGHTYGSCSCAESSDLCELITDAMVASAPSGPVASDRHYVVDASGACRVRTTSQHTFSNSPAGMTLTQGVPITLAATSGRSVTDVGGLIFVTFLLYTASAGTATQPIELAVSGLPAMSGDQYPFSVGTFTSGLQASAPTGSIRVTNLSGVIRFQTSGNAWVGQDPTETVGAGGFIMGSFTYWKA